MDSKQEVLTLTVHSLIVIILKEFFLRKYSFLVVLMKTCDNVQTENTRKSLWRIVHNPEFDIEKPYCTFSRNT
jgi:hypothetical protein